MSAIVLSKLTTIDKKPTPSFKVRPSRIRRGKTGSSQAQAAPPANNGILYSIGAPLEEVNESLKKLIRSNREEDKRKRDEAKRKKLEDREKKLEAPKGSGIKLPRITNPFNKIKFNFFDKIGNFLLFTFLGWVFNNFSLGGASPLVRTITSVLTVGFFELINNTFMFLLDTFVFFVDQGYKLHDTISGLIKRVKGEDSGGDGAPESQNIFNKFTDQLSYAGTLFATSGAIMLAVMAGTKVLANSILDERDKPDKPDKLDPDKPDSKKPPKPSSKSPRAPKGKLSRVKQLARLSTKQIGRKAILKAVRPALRRMTIIGGLLDFGISVALGEPLGRAAFSVIGAGLLGTIGAGLGGPVGAILGGLAGDYIGAKLYDVFFTGKKNVGPKETQKAKSGGKVGRTNKRKRIVSSKAPKRTIQNKSQTIKRPVIRKATPSPGKNVGGPKAITKLFKDPENSWSFSDTIARATGRKKPNPYKALTKIAGIFSGVPAGIGSLMTSTVDVILGQLPIRQLYDNITNSIMYIASSFKAENTQQLLAKFSTFAMGGEIPSERTLTVNSGMMDKSKLSSVLEKSIGKKMRESLSVIRGEISKKDDEKEGERSGESGDGPGSSGDGVGDSHLEYTGEFKGSGMEMGKQIYARLIADGFSPSASAGIVGNIGVESDGFKPDVIEYNTGIGRGWIQWSFGRRTAFERWAKNNKLDPNTADANYKYLMYEMKGGDGNHWMPRADTPAHLRVRSLKEYLEKAKDPKIATELYMYNYLRPNSSQQHLNGRLNYAEEISKVDISKITKEKAQTLNGATLAYKGGATITQSNDPDNQDSGMDVALLDSSGGFNNGAKIPNPVDKLTITKADGWNWNGTRGFGHYITGTFIGKDGKKYELLIGHLHKKSNLRVGQVLTRGQIIGLQGMSGSASGPHATTHVNSLEKGGDPWKVLSNDVVKPWQSGWKAENPTRLAMKNGVEGIIVKENGKEVWKPKVWTAEDKGNHRKQQEKNKPPQLSKPAAAAPRANNTASPVITRMTAADLDKKIRSLKPGSGDKVEIPGVGSIVAGRSRVTRVNMDKYFDENGGRLDRKEFFRRAKDVMRIQQTQTRGGISSLQPQINSNNISRFASYNNPTQTAHVMIQPVIINKPAQQIAKTMGYPFIASGSPKVSDMKLDMGRA